MGKDHSLNTRNTPACPCCPCCVPVYKPWSSLALLRGPPRHTAPTKFYLPDCFAVRLQRPHIMWAQASQVQIGIKMSWEET